MAASQPVSVVFQQAALAITGQLAGLDTSLYDKAEQHTIRQLRRLVAEVRLDIRDYEYADTREELLQHARDARDRLAALRTTVLAAGEAGIFGPADIAQPTASFDGMSDRLQ